MPYTAAVPIAYRIMCVCNVRVGGVERKLAEAETGSVFPKLGNRGLASLGETFFGSGDGSRR